MDEVVVDVQIRVIDVRNKVVVIDLRDQVANYPLLRHVSYEVVFVVIEDLEVQASLSRHIAHNKECQGNWQTLQVEREFNILKPKLNGEDKTIKANNLKDLSIALILSLCNLFIMNVTSHEDVHIDEGGSSDPPPTNENHDADFDTGYDNDFEGGSPKRYGRYFRGYDDIVSKWKNSILPKVAAFSVVYDGVQRMDENGSSDLCAASGPNCQVYGKRNRTSPSSSQNNVNQVVLQIEDVPINEGGSSVPLTTNENHEADFDIGYENDFEGSSLAPSPRSPSRVRPKKKAKGGVSEFEEDMKQAIINLAKGGFSKNKGPSADECHEKLKIIGLESNDLLYLAAFLIFSQPRGNYRDTWMTLPSDPDVWEGTTHNARILNEALIDPEADFLMPYLDKYYLCDAAYRHTRGLWHHIRMLVIILFGWERISDEFFPLYDHREVHGSSNSQDDNVVNEDVQPYGSAADQEYMTSLRDSIAAQCPLMF
ncbi:hypothetical protein Tco_0747949 [Tanacetum coccineum]|uniref:Uncharacterized protein n=1 Tax=Tanacetum coccineum TaxID=301880 RepID=A0ABQ4YX77_9ASTR